MNIAGLSLAQSPPLSVPGPYFVTAPLFGVAAGVMLVFSPELLQNRWLPGTLALTHLLTLGFAAMVMVGAFQQLLPVLMGSPVPRPRLVGLAVYLMLAGGAIALPWGLATGVPAFTVVAIALLAFAFAIFLGVSAWCLLRARPAHAWGATVSVALAALAIAVVLGLYLGVGHAGLSVVVRDLTDLHVLWGTLGWIGLLVMGVAYQVVPMFQITPDYPRFMMRALAPGIFLGLAAWSAAELTLPAAAKWIAAALAAGAASFALATLILQHRRRRRLDDVTVDFWRLGMAALVLAVAIGMGAMWAGSAVPSMLLGVLFVAGFAVSVISGMSYKIVPFLVWLHLNNRTFTYPHLRGQVPHMKQVIPERRARWQWRLHLMALVVLAAAAVTGQMPLARIGGALFAGSSALLACNLGGAIFLYLRLLRGGKKADS